MTTNEDTGTLTLPEILTNWMTSGAPVRVRLRSGHELAGPVSSVSPDFLVLDPESETDESTETYLLDNAPDVARIWVDRFTVVAMSGIETATYA